jgi:hypothetical protein
MNKLLKEIEQLREEMESRGRDALLNSEELLQLSERLDRLINDYILRSKKRAGGGCPRGAPSK